LGKAWPALEIYVGRPNHPAAESPRGGEPEAAAALRTGPPSDPHLLDLVLAELDDFHPTAIEEVEPRLRAFFNTTRDRDSAAGALASSFGVRLSVRPVNIDDENWAARSQAELKAVTVGQIVIAPPWDAAYARSGLAPLWVYICPSMGFGTGHHATTRLMLLAIQQIAVNGQSILDVGCGSGVLALAAARFGARSVVGIDIDPDAIQNARENAGLNDLDDRIQFGVEDFRDYSTRASIVLANLTGGLIQRSAAQLAGLVDSNGALIVSGFMESEKPGVLGALQRSLTLEQVSQEDEWICGVFRSQP
jgi:ribosomal protein L11 methyltransferase